MWVEQSYQTQKYGQSSPRRWQDTVSPSEVAVMSWQCPEGEEADFRCFCGSEGKLEVKGFHVSQSEGSFGFYRAGTSPLDQVSALCPHIY